MRRSNPAIVKTACLAFVTILFFIAYIRPYNRSFLGGDFSGIVPSSPDGTVYDGNANSNEQPFRDANSTLLELAPPYIKAIMNADDETFSLLDCPPPTPDRYEYLREIAPRTRAEKQVKYFFALDLYQAVNLLPQLLGSIVETIKFIGPEICALSIVEGRSEDGTFEILKLLRSEIEGIGAKYFFTTSDIEPGSPKTDRIKGLAALRNQALEPLLKYTNDFSSDATVIFLNDVVICTQDILELIHQKVLQKADMTCALDWAYVGQDPTFYDVWIARGITGDTFFNIPEDGNWNSAWNLFWNDDKSRQRVNTHKPFQVFSCWNGATAFTAKPIVEKTIRFRAPTENECYQGEPKLFCKDMWKHGYGKIAVVPSINLVYKEDQGPKIKALKGFVSEMVGNDAEDSEMQIQWESDPPANVKCMPNYEKQTWPAWDEGL